MIGVEINAEQLRRKALQLGATDDIVKKAMRSTAAKMQSYTRTRSSRELADVLKIKRSIVRKRIRLRARKYDGKQVSAPVWYGINAVRLIDLNAKRAPGGVRAMAGRYVPGAFIAPGRNGRYQVFKRTTRARTPLMKIAVDIAEGATDYLQGMIDGAEYGQKFIDIFAHEIEWRMQKLT